MFVTQQPQPIISDVNYQDPSQVEILRQQLANQYENHCYGSKRLSSSQQNKSNTQSIHSTINSKKGVPKKSQKANRAVGNDNKNSIQNEKIKEALFQKVTNTASIKQDDNTNLYQVEVPKTSQKRRTQNLSPQQRGSQTLSVESMKQGLTQKQYENSAYLSPLIQNCLEEDIVTHEQQRYSSAPSRKFVEIYDYSKEKLQKMYGMTGNFEMKTFEKKETPEKNISQVTYEYNTQDKNYSQASQLYHIDIENEKEINKNLLYSSNKQSIHYTSQGQMSSQQQTLTVPPRIQVNSQRNSSVEGEKTKVFSQINSQEELIDIKKKIDFTESFDIGKGRNSVQIMKQNNIQSHNQNAYWSVSKKRNSTGLINQLQSTKQSSNEDNYQFTGDQRHTHQLIKTSGIYLRNKPEYLSDPRYKLIENLNKISQTVNIANINNSSVRNDSNKKADMSRIIPYYHNFMDSYRESFYHPQTNFENKYKIYNPRKSQDMNQLLPHQAYSRFSANTPRGSAAKDQSFLEDKMPQVTPFQEKEFGEEEFVRVKYANKLSQSSKATQEDQDEEEFQYYQNSMNRYNCLYLNRNQRVRVSRNSSPNRKKHNQINQSVDSNLSFKKQNALFEDPRKEYRDRQKKLEEMLNIASSKKNNQYDNTQTFDRYTPIQESVYLKKTRNYGTPFRPNNNQPQITQSQLNDYTLDAFVFKNQSNSSQK